MKRFIDICSQGTGYRFAWWDTTVDKFEEFQTEQAWDTWEDFANVCQPEELDRYRGLCPSWVFEPFTEEDKEKEDAISWEEVYPVEATGPCGPLEDSPFQTGLRRGREIAATSRDSAQKEEN